MIGRAGHGFECAALAGLLSAACCGGGSDAVDAGATPDASIARSVMEHLAAVGDWTLDTRIRDESCPECRTVAQYEFDADALGLAIVRYADVAPAGTADGDELCRNVYSLTALPTEGVDPTLRSRVTLRLDSNTCGNPNGGMFTLIFDASTPVDQGPVEFVTVFGALSGAATEPWPGFRESLDDTRFASLYRPCPEADRVSGRQYCAASCDTPATEPGEVECTSPDFAPDFPECNAIVNTGSSIEQMNVAAALPAPLGGTPLDGTYHLTGWNTYTGVGGASGGTGNQRAMTGTIQGDAVSMVVELGPGFRVYANYTLLNSGQFAIVTQVCPDVGGVALDTFSAVGDQLILYDTPNSVSLEFTLVS